MATLSALVSGLDAELVRLGYKDSTMAWYRGCWRRMEKYFAARGIEEFSLDVAMAWVDDACGFFGKEQAGTLKRTDVYWFRVAQTLEDYAVHGAVLRRYNRSVCKLSGDGAEAVARFQAHLRAEDRAASTVRTYGTLAGEFVAFTGTRGGLASCDAATIGAFVATLTGYQFKTVEQKLCAVRSFLRFASADGLVGAACLVAVPAARSSRQARIPSVSDPGEVARIVEAIDRDNPARQCGGWVFKRALPRHSQQCGGGRDREPDCHVRAEGLRRDRAGLDDSYTENTGFGLTMADDVAFNRTLANYAHGLGLSYGLKNGDDPSYAAQMLPIVDFALDEQCFQYSTCGAFFPSFRNAGKAVFEVEYNIGTQSFCPQAVSDGFNAVRQNVNLNGGRQPCS